MKLNDLWPKISSFQWLFGEISISHVLIWNCPAGTSTLNAQNECFRFQALARCFWIPVILNLDLPDLVTTPNSLQKEWESCAVTQWPPIHVYQTCTFKYPSQPKQTKDTARIFPLFGRDDFVVPEITKQWKGARTSQAATLNNHILIDGNGKKHRFVHFQLIWNHSRSLPRNFSLNIWGWNISRSFNSGIISSVCITTLSVHPMY